MVATILMFRLHKKLSLVKSLFINQGLIIEDNTLATVGNILQSHGSLKHSATLYSQG